MTKIHLEMDRVDALRANLLVCECGHPSNNHFLHDTKPCAHCKCQAYVETARYGRLLKPRKR